MLDPGDTIPDAVVWTQERRPVRLRDLVADGPALLVFYLFDFSAT